MQKMPQTHPIPLPCPVISESIGNVINEIQRTSNASAKRQLELQLSSLERLYESQCEGPRKPANTMGARLSMTYANNFFFLNHVTEPGKVVTLIFGGNDGILITIDPQGVIHVSGPAGPGDPEVRPGIDPADPTTQRTIINIMESAVARLKNSSIAGAFRA
jgi:hypothetical protein